MKKRVGAVAVALLLSVGVVVAISSPASAQAPPEPIVFVHGWNSSTGTWNTMVGRFTASGFPSNRIYRFGYNTSQSNKTSAAQLNAFIDQVRAQTGSPTVDIVSHSMGALVSRWCTKFSGCNGKVDDLVTLAGVNHGTYISLCFWQTSCREMFPSSGFVSDLNSVDETWGSASYTAYWSDRDAVVDPDSSARLSGATNILFSIGHSDFLSSSAVFNDLRPRVVD